ncbi:anillin-like isoform X2 [Aphidius gifuensis]|uniref:anillin-like isoform X2 n=1 Tax=Aphidius gifuensis TaxID=684658 RepID=UPI001CDB6E00|nr:anillin-like isoform X2 [Aphidius gifuensis]
MDPFAQRMLERAKKRRELLDERMTNAGHDVRARRSPLRDANVFSTAIAQKSPTKNVTASNATVAPKASSVSVEDSHDDFSSQESLNSVDQIMKSPSKPSLSDNNKKLSICNETRDKENVEKNVSNVRSKLNRMGKLYSDDCSRELSSPIHRTEEKFTAEDEEALREKKNVKCGARTHRLAALASQINNWEDDLSHPTLPPLKKGESKAEKIQAKMNEQVKAGSSEPQPSTSGYGRWKSNADSQPGANNSLNRQFKWDKTIIENLEAQGYTRTKSNSRLVYDYKNCSQDKKSPKDTKGDNKRKKEDTSVLTKVIQPTESSTKSPSKNTKILDTSIKSTSSNGSRNRFGNYNGSPKSTVQSGSPGSVLSKASLFETKNTITRTKDPAEMTLSERMALFERNKGEALIPKAPLSSSVPTKKLMEQRDKPSSSSNYSSDQLMRNGSGSSVSSNRALFEQGIAKQELEKDVIRDSQNERQKELEMLRSRFNKNKENAQAAAGSCIRPRQNSEPTTTSPKNSPVCPVKPTPAMDYVPPAPPLPGSPMTSTRSEPIQTRCSPSKRQVAGTPPQSSSSSSSSKLNKRQSNFNDVKRQKVSSSPSRLYPNLAEMESSETETPDTEYTIGTTEAETATCDETDYDYYQEEDEEESNIEEMASSSFENSVLRVVKDRNSSINKKRTIEPSIDDSSTSDISVLDEMNEFLEGCLDDDDEDDDDENDYNNRGKRTIGGPTPPKLNRAAEDSPSMASKSFKYTHGSAKRSSLVVTPKREQYIVDDGNKVPLMHSVSFYRRQQSQTPKTPIKSISRTVEIVSDYDYTSGIDEKQEAALVQDKIKYLKDEVNKQQTIIGQSSQAVNLCAATIEFSGSREQVEGERTLLIATHRRQAALNEIQRLKVEGTIKPSSPGSSSVQESGTLTVSAITLPLKKDHMRNNDENMCIHFLCLVRHLDTIIATPIVLAEPGDSCIRFPSTLKLDNLYSDFKVTIEVYSLETRAEILPHDVKYHIHNNGHSSGHSNNKKNINKTPKKYLKQESRLIMPTVQSPAGPSAVRTPSFTLSGYVIFSLKEINRQQFTLNKVPRNSALESRLQMHVTCELSVDVEHRGFLTMFEDVSGFGAWHRRWCLLKGDTLSYWKYPDDEKKKTPIGSLELQGVSTKNVGLVARDICARPNTFLLETVRPFQSNDVECLTVIRCGSLTTIRHLLSADTKEERLEWCSKLNQTLNLLRAWSGNSS